MNSLLEVNPPTKTKIFIWSSHFLVQCLFTFSMSSHLVVSHSLHGASEPELLSCWAPWLMYICLCRLPFISCKNRNHVAYMFKFILLHVYLMFVCWLYVTFITRLLFDIVMDLFLFLLRSMWTELWPSEMMTRCVTTCLAGGAMR